MTDPKSSRQHFTFRGNSGKTRYGWLRLTPAYSVELVRSLLQQQPSGAGLVLDPFCGTGTTALACAELGLSCDTTELNPFLVWLARTKCARYSRDAITQAERLIVAMSRACAGAGERTRRARLDADPTWTPALHRIERWWDRPTLSALSLAHRVLEQRSTLSRAARNLARLAFCRTLIGRAHVSFGHQSMSFKARPEQGRVAGGAVAELLQSEFSSIARAADGRLGAGRRRVLLGDARHLERLVPGRRYHTVITSPPYCNRMSYVRELRPYMYWLGYLSAPSEAGELDWRAIGGTWGTATSRLGSWTPPSPELRFPGKRRLLAEIAERSPLLSRYVERYFCDMREHLASLFQVTETGARVHYIIGNSKFFDVLLPTERILAALLSEHGFADPQVQTLRKRSSKRELFEFSVSATRR